MLKGNFSVPVLLCILFFNISLRAQVVADFTSDDTVGCGLLELSMINLSTGATSYYWEVLNETGDVVATSSLSNPSFFLITTGSYTVQLTATGVSGSDVLTIVGFANVYTSPSAEFISSDTEGCSGTTFTFSNTSVPGTYGSISDYYWIITGAGTLPTTPEISYVFTSPGTYTVYLFVEDAAGCSDYTSTDIEIFELPDVDFLADSTVACSLPLVTHFTNTSSGAGILTYLWNFGDGSTSTLENPTHVYTSIGNYTVSLTVTDELGCTNSLSITDLIVINTTLNVDFVPASTLVCAGTEVEFTNLSDATSGTWLWDFGDGTTSDEFEPAHNYTSPGTYSVSLNGDFGGGCTGAVAYANLITVIASPTVSFTSTDPTSFCSVPLNVSFTPVVTGGPVTFLWEFETPTGTSTSTAMSPNFSWTEPGAYDVSLTVTNLSGCSAQITMTDYVVIGILEVTPTVSPESGCIPLPVSFSESSGADISEYFWDFGDGFTSTESNPSHIYNSVDCFNVTLIAQTADGCIDTTTVVELVCAGETGTALLGLPDTSCPSVSINVDYLPLDSITISIDGGLDFTSTADVDSITGIGLNPGYHDLVLYTWINGCVDSIATSIFILDVDDSTLVYDISCEDPYTVQFFIDTILAELSCGWTWDFGDGVEDSVNMNPIHTYDTTGVFHVTIVYDCITETECTGLGLDVTITEPVSDFDFDAYACDTPYTAIFENQSYDGAGGVLTYFWNFGDGTTSTDENPEHVYTDYGNYNVGLQVTDSKGCTDTYITSMTINKVDANFAVDDDYGCTPFTFHYYDNSTSEVGDIASWYINWADGTTSTLYSAGEVSDIEHTYSVSGTYVITLTVTDFFGCSDTYTDTVKSKLPTVDFSADDLNPCVGQNVVFTELASGSGLTYFWEFGDGSTSILANPEHAYAMLGSYTITLTVTDSYGCINTISKPAYISAEEISADFTYEIVLSNCNYSLVQFNSIIEDSICSFYWNFGDGGTSTDPNPLYPYLEAGSFSVSLTVTDCNDCSVVIYKEGFIEVPGPYGYITPSKDSVCVGEELILSMYIYSSDSAQLFLDNGDLEFVDLAMTTDLTIIDIPYTYYEAGYYGPTALVVDTSGCLNILFITDSILVSPLPESNYEISDVQICLGTEILFSDSSTSINPISNWLWNTGDSEFNADTSISFNYTYPDTGTYYTSLEVQTIFGCTDIMEIPVEVVSVPIFNLSDDTIICPGTEVQLSATNGYVYLWSPPEGLSSSVVPNPVAYPSVTTLYTVVVSNGVCSLLDSVVVQVVDELILDAGPDTILCGADEIDLYALLTNQVPESSILFYWQPDSFITDIFIPDPVSTTPNTITYTAYATCGWLEDSAEVTVVITGPPDIDIPVDTITTLAGQSVNITAELLAGNEPLTYEWIPPGFVDCPTCLDVNVVVEYPMVLGIITTDSLGCTDYDYVYLRVVPCDESVFKIPNIISPNNDGFNDNFHIEYTGVAELRQISIFDRWGERMFQTKNVDDRWDGTYRGQICNPGVYVYTIEFICADGNESVVSGNITLVK